MNTVLVFLIFVVIIIAIIVIVDKSKIFAKPEPLKGGPQVTNSKSNVPVNKYLPTPAWSKPVPYNQDSTGICQPYTFIGGQSVPAQPSYQTLNNGVRDYVTGNVNQTCIDVDQLFAQTISHQCLYPNSNSGGAGCILTVDTDVPGIGVLKAGEFAPVGTIEGDTTIGSSQLLYSQCTPSNLSNNRNGTLYCLGDIGLVIPNFGPQAQSGIPPGGSGYNYCLASLGNTGSISLQQTGSYTTYVQECDLSEPNQIFRMTRYSYDPVSQILTQNDAGNLASIVHRPTGYYLAPDLNFNIITSTGVTGSQVTGATGVEGYYYLFDQLFTTTYNPSSLPTDYTNNTYRQSSNLILINPAYDASRNGVYWLLQNETYDATVNESTLQISGDGYNAYVNQDNYSIEFPAGPVVQSYWYTQAYAQGIAGVGPLSIPNGSSRAACEFGLGTTDGANTQITIEGNLAPQQIVYVPNLRLLPTDPNDTTGIWNYLINSFSINMTSDLRPILTNYRQSSNLNVRYYCRKDPNDDNYFTYIQKSSDIVANEQNGVYGDTQFINYSQFTQQIQTPVSSITVGAANVNYAGKRNPFTFPTQVVGYGNNQIINSN